MADPSPTERLQPSLLDRLTDDAPTVLTEPREARVLTKGQLRAAVFKNPSTLAELTFVTSLNPNLGIRILHAGEGTLWTDLKNLAPSVPVK